MEAERSERTLRSLRILRDYCRSHTASRHRRGWQPTLVIAAAMAATSAAGQNLSPQDLLWSESNGLAVPAELDAEAAGRDVAILLYALDRAYGGRGVVPEREFSQAREGLRQLEARPPATPRELCEAVGDLLFEIPDNHLSVHLQGDSCGEARSKRRRRPSVGPNLEARSADTKAWAVRPVEVGAVSLPALSITEFPDPEDSAWEGYTEALAELMKAPGIIVDLRGNRGGADSRGRELAQRLLGYEPPYFFDAVSKRQTPEALALQLNSARIEMFSLRRRGQPIPDYLVEYERETQELYQQALRGELPPESRSSVSAEPPPGPPAYSGPVALLVDADCASSCEGTVLYLLAHPRAAAIGEATGGYLHFGDVAALVLPHSRIYIAVPTKAFQIREAFYERNGIPPMIPSPAGEDALETAKRWLVGQLTLR